MKPGIKLPRSVGEKNIVLGILYVIGFAAMWFGLPGRIIGGIFGAVWLIWWIFCVFTSGVKYAAGELAWWTVSFVLQIVCRFVSAGYDSLPSTLMKLSEGPALAFTGAPADRIYLIIAPVMMLFGVAGILFNMKTNNTHSISV